MIPFARADRVGGLIQKALSEILQKQVKDPRLEMITITGVKMTRDLRLARIYFSTSAGKKHLESAEQGFKSALGYLKRALSQRLGLRYMPDIQFIYDKTLDHGAEIDKLLNRIKMEDEANIKAPSR
jgi:ribosome-binding factor A